MDASRAGRHPLAPHPVQRGNRLLVLALDGDRMDPRTAQRLAVGRRRQPVVPEALELSAREAAALRDASRAVRDGYLEDVLGQVYGNGYVVHRGSSGAGYLSGLRTKIAPATSRGRSPIYQMNGDEGRAILSDPHRILALRVHRKASGFQSGPHSLTNHPNSI